MDEFEAPDGEHAPIAETHESLEVRITALRAELEMAESKGLLGYDRPRARFVRALLERAESRPSGAERIVERAATRFAALMEDFDAAREATRDLLADLDESSDPGGLIKRSFLAGEYREVRRALRRRAERRTRHAVEAEQRARFESRWVARRGRPLDDAQVAVHELAEALYLDRRGDQVARQVLTRLRADLPVEAGPYHAPTVAAHVLSYLDEVSRPLVRAWMQRLDNIAAFEELELELETESLPN